MKETYKLTSEYPSISGIIANISKGRRWDDETHLPGIHVAYSYCVGGYGVTGVLDNYSDEEIRRFFDTLFHEITAESEKVFEFSAESEEMRQRLLYIFADKQIFSETEYSLRAVNRYEKLTDLPDGVSVHPVDQNMITLFESGTIKNAELFLERFYHSWRDRRSFLDNSGAFAAIQNNTVIGIVFGSSSYEKIVSIDIEVSEEYRKKKIARRLTEETVNSFLDRGLVLQWDCTESNVISYKMAKSMGFEQIRERRYDWFEI